MKQIPHFHTRESNLGLVKSSRTEPEIRNQENEDVNNLCNAYLFHTNTHPHFGFFSVDELIQRCGKRETVFCKEEEEKEIRDSKCVDRTKIIDSK